MTTYRLINNVFEFKEAFVDFRAMRRNYDGLKVWFNEKNESLKNNLKDKWKPIDVKFDASSSAKKSSTIPDISVWNMSCLVISKKALEALEPLLEKHGEVFPLNNNFYLFNCLSSINNSAIDEQNSSFEIDQANADNTELLGIPKKLTLIPSEIKNIEIFKPEFSHNSFLICQDKFKKLVNQENLGGLIFEENLAQMFPIEH